MPTLFVATSNTNKLRELVTLLDMPDLVLVTPAAVPAITPPDESGATFAQNARDKALAYARETEMVSLADDSGLVVDALGGRPGVHSARFAGEPSDDAANLAMLLRLMEGISDTERTARFQCVVAVASGESILAEATGQVEGVISAVPRGRHGFGYDPVFFYPPAGQTFAELDPAEKNRVSHRGRALAAIVPRLRRILDDAPPDPAREW